MALLGMAGAGPASAQTAAAKKKKSSPPASIAPAGGSSKENAQQAFDTFAKEWMAKMEAAGRQNAKKSGGSASTLRGYSKEWTTEIKPTGSTSAPYVGLLRYVEEERSCKDAALMDCRVTSTTGVTEIFRFQGGKWVY
jgi:hypothetical protein